MGLLCGVGVLERGSSVYERKLSVVIKQISEELISVVASRKGGVES